MNFNTARKNMLLNQIRTWDFISPETIDMMQQVQREEFVPVEHRKIAFCDFEVPLAHDEFMMKPVLEGRILQSLALKGDERVLEIGTGSGYMTALLSIAAKHVTSIDIHQDFIDSSKEKLAEAKITNNTCNVEDIFNHQTDEKYDVVVATGSFESLPSFLLNLIKPEGKVFAIVGQEPNMSAMIFSGQSKNDIHTETLFETVVKPLRVVNETSSFKL